MKFLKSIFKIIFGIIFAITIIGGVNNIKASTIKDNDMEKITITDSNTIYQQFEEETQKLYTQNLLPSDFKVKMRSLIQKYDGAEVTYSIYNNEMEIKNGIRTLRKSITKPAAVQEKFIDGGINDFAKSKSALAKLRTYYGKCYALSVTAGSIAGATFGGPMGAVAGVFGGSVLGTRCSQAQSDVKRMINKGRSKGGCRMTITDEFPIASINSKKQAKI